MYKYCRYLTVFVMVIVLIVTSGCEKDEDPNGDEKPKVETGAVMDAQDNVYATVRIGDQWWMAENLRVTVYNDGTEIPNLEDGNEWMVAGEGAYVFYNNDRNLAGEFGALYNWFAVVDEKGICPAGWEVPSEEDWQDLERHLGMNEDEISLTGLRGDIEGGMLKDTGIQIWSIPNVGATNETGFSALPAGSRQVEPIVFFDFLTEETCYWTTTASGDNNAWSRGLTFKTSGIFRYGADKRDGYSVRCLKNQTTP